MGVSRATVRKWRVRFDHDRIEELADEPRPGKPRVTTNQQVDKVIGARFESTPPQGDTHWTTRSTADSSGLSQSTVSRIWRVFALRPHVVQTWKFKRISMS
ncbi:helix-turn-helix domain-containing protein [Nocardia sp. NPDC056064]|uniref:helix-turn-helix domain-containing protein n=1 Tax=Nocardia sp. NPDC056064 TaxID=3345701 RepID=UPI0035E306EF